ncbi:MAG TPA: RNA polymerase subunit sigma-24, partial [Verrucomicrobiales bacterium]|nr:RNA polymerase subunit sigma-24 [Verrucomicrobiales bacterium]
MKADTGELKEWVLRSKRGDLSAFEELVRLHQPMVRQLAYRFSGNAADAADLAQEAFVRAWQNIGTQREDAPFGAWLRRVTVNVCLQWRRDRRDG